MKSLPILKFLIRELIADLRHRRTFRSSCQQAYLDGNVDAQVRILRAACCTISQAERRQIGQLIRKELNLDVDGRGV
jgi:hypothetical protein